MTLALAILGGVLLVSLAGMLWGLWATRKPWVININLDDRPDYYKRIEKELRDG